MKNIILTRVDDRLIHGQITIGWLNKINVDTIVIVDEELSKNNFLSNMTKKAAPDKYKVEIFNEESFINYYRNEKDEKLLVLTKRPQTYEKIQNISSIFEEINIGNIGSKDESIKIYKNIYLNPEEKEAIKNLLKKGCIVYAQLLPEDSKINFEKLI
jgi:PTS system mannose-specific IIB component